MDEYMLNIGKMIPMTLDSILEGILDEELSTSSSNSSLSTLVQQPSNAYNFEDGTGLVSVETTHGQVAGAASLASVSGPQDLSGFGHQRMVDPKSLSPIPEALASSSSSSSSPSMTSPAAQIFEYATPVQPAQMTSSAKDVEVCHQQTPFHIFTGSCVRVATALAGTSSGLTVTSIPCSIPVKSELPDSCTMDLMMDCNEAGDDEQSLGDLQSPVKEEAELRLIYQEKNFAAPFNSKVASPVSPESPGGQHCSSTTSNNLSIHATYEDDLKEEEEEDCPKRMCLVCGDIASGFHYGVSSCEACKAFFKRTIQGNIDYSCPASSDCEINKRRRKACQACRYQKCLRMGMLKEGVRLDRVRGGRQKYRSRIRHVTLEHVYGTQAPPAPPLIHAEKKLPSLEENKLLCTLLNCEPSQSSSSSSASTSTSLSSSSSSSSSPSSSSSSSPLSSSKSSSSISSNLTTPTNPLITSLGSVLTQENPTTLSRSSSLKGSSQLQTSKNQEKSPPSPSTLKTLTTLADFYERELFRTIGWAKQIPGFTELTLNDQMRLLQGSWSEILTLTLVFRSLNNFSSASSSSPSSSSTSLMPSASQKISSCRVSSSARSPPSSSFSPICNNEVDCSTVMQSETCDKTRSSSSSDCKKLKTTVLESTLMRQLQRKDLLIFATDFTLSESKSSECGLQDFYRHSMKVIQRFEQIGGLKKEEYVLLKALLLTNCDVIVEEKVALANVKESLLRSLQDCINITRSKGQGPSFHLQNILLLLPSIRQADSILRRFWIGVRSQGLITMSKLLAEMLEAQTKYNL